MQGIPKQDTGGSGGKINNWQMTLYEVKSFCKAKESVSQVKRQPTEMREKLPPVYQT